MPDPNSQGSGLAWTMAGGQAILTLRSLLQSGRWAQAWPLLAADFCHPVVIPDQSMEVPLPLAAQNQPVRSIRLLNLGDAPLSYVPLPVPATVPLQVLVGRETHHSWTARVAHSLIQA